MKKIVIIIGLLVATGFAIGTLCAWSQGKLFLRVPAKITLNGIDSDKSEIYKSRNGDYFLILEKGTAEPTTYWIGEERIGTLIDYGPAMETWSFQTEYFLIYLNFETELAGTEWYAPGAKWSVSEKEIDFQVNSDNVNIKF